MNIIFFGSTFDSVIVLDRLSGIPFISITAVVTQLPKPVGREQIITPTPVEIWAKEHHITVLSFPSRKEKSWQFADEAQVTNALETFKADLIISASFGQMIPWEIIEKTRYGGINVHPSLLPRWRGADPVPWAILAGDHQTGVSVVTLSKTFDEGHILAQKKLPITDTDFSDPLRTRLFEMGADLVMGVLKNNSNLIDHRVGAQNNLHANSLSKPYARKFKRDDGFVPWQILTSEMSKVKREKFEEISIIQTLKKYGLSDGAKKNPAEFLTRMYRALHPWPGIFTKITMGQLNENNKPVEKRLKILSCHLSPDTNTLVIDQVQLEGKNPVSWEQFRNAYLPTNLPS